MFEPVSSSLIDDEDDEMSESPPHPLLTSIDDADGFPDNDIQPSVSYHQF
jgi:hypothetical protein